MYKAPPPEVSSEQFYETDEQRGFARGFQHPDRLPIADRMGRARARRRALGPGASGVHARLQPLGNDRGPQRAPANADNRVTLADERDQYGMPIARFDHSLAENDKPQHGLFDRRDWGHPARGRCPGHAHHPPLRSLDRRLPDGNRTREQRRRSEPAELGGAQSLYLADGSVCPTQGSANPALTIMALASRLADHLRSNPA